MAKLNPTSNRAALYWIVLAIGALVLAGTFSLGLVIGRVPPFSHLVTDPGFFRRLLVVHVDLALVVWFYAFIAGLLYLSGRRTAPAWDRLGWRLGAVGVLSVIISAFVPGTEPVLANYVPVIDHPAFVVGLSVFGFGVVVASICTGWGESRRPAQFPIFADAHYGLRAAAVALVAAAATFAVAAVTTPHTLEAAAFYELVAWGGGHVLQVASEAAMLAVWLILLGSMLERPVLNPRLAKWLFVALVGPHLVMPVFAALGTTEALYYHGATQLMRFGIFPVVLVVLFGAVHALRVDREKWRWSDPRIVGFLASAALTLTGFAIGAMIRGSSTMIPAHYHAAIGAVTVSFMTFAIVIAVPHLYGISAPSIFGVRARNIDIANRWRALQPALFGGGQVVFAIGFGAAGANGMARKVYGAEQSVRSLTDWIGLGTMGVGGLIAVSGGLLFVLMFIRAAGAASLRATPSTHPVGRHHHD